MSFRGGMETNNDNKVLIRVRGTEEGFGES